MYKYLKISHAAYYKFTHSSVPEQELENLKLAEWIKEYAERFFNPGIQENDQLEQSLQSHEL